MRSKAAAPQSRPVQPYYAVSCTNNVLFFLLSFVATILPFTQAYLTWTETPIKTVGRHWRARNGLGLCQNVGGSGRCRFAHGPVELILGHNKIRRRSVNFPETIRKASLSSSESILYSGESSQQPIRESAQKNLYQNGNENQFTENSNPATEISNDSIKATDSTAIILNMNARSVTSELISIASDIVGEENVFVTKSAKEAKLAARAVVHGRSALGNAPNGNNEEHKNKTKYSLVVPVGGDGTLSGWINTMVDEILLMHEEKHSGRSKTDILDDVADSSKLVTYESNANPIRIYNESGSTIFMAGSNSSTLANGDSATFFVTNDNMSFVSNGKNSTVGHGLDAASVGNTRHASSTSNHPPENTPMSVEEALKQLPLMGYIPMGTGNGLGYVIGCRIPKKAKKQSQKTTGKMSMFAKLSVLRRLKRRKLENTRQVICRLKEVGDAVQQLERAHELEKSHYDSKPDRVDPSQTLELESALSGKYSIVEMPLMEVTHHSKDAITSLNDKGANINDSIQYSATNEPHSHPKGDLCFFAGAGFDSLMLHDFQQIKAWAKSSRRAPAFIKETLSSVAGYCVALVAKTLPQTLRYGTHKIHVVVTTKDEGTLWVDHRRGDFSELAVGRNSLIGQKAAISNSLNGHSSTDGEQTQQRHPDQHLIYSGTTGILAAATTPYYGGGLRLFPYARLIPNKLQLRLGRISPLTGFFNIPKIFEGSYREKSEGDFGCLDFIGEDFEVEVSSGKYDEYLKMKEGKRERKRRGLKFWRSRSNVESGNGDEIGTESKGGAAAPERAGRGFPFQHSGESMGCKERFRLRVVKEPVRFVSFLEPRVIADS